MILAHTTRLARETNQTNPICINLIGLHRNLVIYVDEHDNLMLAGLTMRRSPSPKDRNGLGIFTSRKGRMNSACMGLYICLGKAWRLWKHDERYLAWNFDEKYRRPLA